MKKNVINTIIQKPLKEMRARSSKAFDRYHDLFRSIKKLARPQKVKKEEKGSSE